MREKPNSSKVKMAKKEYSKSIWTLTKYLKKQDGNKTRMLHAVLNIYWKYHPRKQ